MFSYELVDNQSKTFTLQNRKNKKVLSVYSAQKGKTKGLMKK